jgi:hypothetical protein
MFMAQFEGMGLTLKKESVDKIHVLYLDADASRIARKTKMCHFYHDFRHDVGRDGDDSLRAERHERDDLIVVTGPDVKVVAAEIARVRGERKVARGLLDPVELRIF